MSRNGGTLAESGAVIWNFDRKGIINISKGGFSEEDILSVIIDAGADDLVEEPDFFQVTTSLESFESVRKTLESSNLPGLNIENASLQYVAKTLTKSEGKDAEQVLRLISALEDHDDVQNVYSNADIDEKILSEFNG
jgi:transcriptional/translational regulatory protein YebC/TACO1